VNVVSFVKFPGETLTEPRSPTVDRVVLHDTTRLAEPWSWCGE